MDEQLVQRNRSVSSVVNIQVSEASAIVLGFDRVVARRGNIEPQDFINQGILGSIAAYGRNPEIRLREREPNLLVLAAHGIDIEGGFPANFFKVVECDRRLLLEQGTS